jgi:hypothetical protein
MRIFRFDHAEKFVCQMLRTYASKLRAARAARLFPRTTEMKQKASKAAAPAAKEAKKPAAAKAKPKAKSAGSRSK